MENKTLDFAANVENPDELELTYSATLNDEAIELTDNGYTLAFAAYTEAYTTYTFTVKVSYTANEQASFITYNYVLNVRDTSAFRPANYNFEKDLEGWARNTEYRYNDK